MDQRHRLPLLPRLRRRGYLLVSRAGHSNGTWTPTAHPIEDVTAIDGVPAALAVWRAALDAGEPWARRDEAYVEEGAMGLVRGVMVRSATRRCADWPRRVPPGGRDFKSRLRTPRPF